MHPVQHSFYWQEDRLRKKTSHKSMKQWVEEKDFSIVYETSNRGIERVVLIRLFLVR